MKGRSLTIIGILAGIIAAVLLFGYKFINSSNVTITAGIIFMAVGVINLIVNSASAKGGNSVGRAFTLIANSASIILGLSMIIFNSTFSPLIAFIFALLVAISALWQFFVLAVGARPHQLPAWLYVFPVCLAGGALYMFLYLVGKDTESDTTLMLATGISMAVLAAGSILEGSFLGVARRTYEKALEHSAAAEAPADTVETPAEPPVTADKPATHKIETTEDLDDEIKDANYE